MRCWILLTTNLKWIILAMLQEFLRFLEITCQTIHLQLDLIAVQFPFCRLQSFGMFSPWPIRWHLEKFFWLKFWKYLCLCVSYTVGIVSMESRRKAYKAWCRVASRPDIVSLAWAWFVTWASISGFSEVLVHPNKIVLPTHLCLSTAWAMNNIFFLLF